MWEYSWNECNCIVFKFRKEKNCISFAIMYRTFFSPWMCSQGLCVASTQEFLFSFLRFRIDEGRRGDATQWMWLRSGENRRKWRRRKAGRYAAKRCNKEMRIFRLPFMRRQDRFFILRQAVFEEHSGEDPRFTSTWAPSNTESMSVLWNVLSCRAASFSIFRSTLACLVHDLFLRTIILYLHRSLSLHHVRLFFFIQLRFASIISLSENDTYFLSQ